MRKRFAIVAAVGVALIAVGASADLRSVHDPRGDTKCYHDHTPPEPCSDGMKRAADIVRARAGHDGTQLRHTIRVVGKFDAAGLLINTDSDPECEWYVAAKRGSRGVEECAETIGGSQGAGLGPARYDFHRHSVEISFSKKSIGNPQSYGWNVFSAAGKAKGSATDWVPNREGYITHRLGDSGTAAAGVMALGARTSQSGRPRPRSSSTRRIRPATR